MSAQAQFAGGRGPSRFSPKGWGWANSLHFAYVLNPPPMPNGAIGVVAQVQIDDDADFMWDAISSVCGAFTSLAGSLPGGFTVYLENSSEGVPLIGSPLAALGAFVIGATTTSIGAAIRQPTVAYLPRPHLLRRGTVITGTFNNTSGDANANVVQVCLVGRKVGL